MEELFGNELVDLLNYKATSNDGKHVMAPFMRIFDDFLKQIDLKFEEFRGELRSISEKKDEKIGSLETEVECLKKLLTAQDDKHDELNQYGRRESLVFSGDSVPGGSDRDCVQVVCDLISTKLPGLAGQITPDQISIAHRLGPKPNNTEPDRRKIIARFCRRSDKYRVLHTARKSKPDKFFVSENLTPTRQKILRAIGKAKKEHPGIISGSSTNDGSIHVWVKPPNASAPGARNSKITINTMDTLEKFFQRTFQRSATYYLPRPWSNTDDA